jgi:hypothetical protein
MLQKLRLTGHQGCQTSFVVMLGFGPILAPSATHLKEATILDFLHCLYFAPIPGALAKTLPVLITLPTFAGFFGCKYKFMHRAFEC